MATTENGIYYPGNYEEIADVPEDMKKQADSIDVLIAKFIYINTKNKTNTTKIMIWKIYIQQ